MQTEDETFRLRCCIYARMFHRKCVCDGDTSVGRRLACTVAIGADVDDDDDDDVDGDEDKTMM